MDIKFKKLQKEAVTPYQGKAGDACWDLTATSVESNYEAGKDYVEYGTGIAIQVPEDHVALLFPRSSITSKDLLLKNSVGVIDAGYRGEIKFRFWATNPEPIQYAVGDRIGQIMIIPRPFIDWKEVEELSSTQRNTGGYGSTGS